MRRLAITTGDVSARTTGCRHCMNCSRHRTQRSFTSIYGICEAGLDSKAFLSQWRSGASLLTRTRSCCCLLSAGLLRTDQGGPRVCAGPCRHRHQPPAAQHAQAGRDRRRGGVVPAVVPAGRPAAGGRGGRRGREGADEGKRRTQGTTACFPCDLTVVSKEILTVTHALALLDRRATLSWQEQLALGPPGYRRAVWPHRAPPATRCRRGAAPARCPPSRRVSRDRR